ncbi:MAG TPA: hypothetical protein VNC82_18215 [Candidatus Limnocylindria bacterium]|nr:hypothetical protein [Candidatus Limnocylindria bacterium]
MTLRIFDRRSADRAAPQVAAGQVRGCSPPAFRGPWSAGLVRARPETARSADRVRTPDELGTELGHPPELRLHDLSDRSPDIVGGMSSMGTIWDADPWLVDRLTDAGGQIDIDLLERRAGVWMRRASR